MPSGTGLCQSSDLAFSSFVGSGLAASGKGPSGPPPPPGQAPPPARCSRAPSELLPEGRGSLPCPRLESRRSGKSPWRRAISVAGSGSVLFPSPCLQPTARSAPPLSSWDVALAAAGEPGRTARREMSSRHPGPLRRRRQRHLPPATGTGLSVRRWGGRARGGARGGAYSCSRESRDVCGSAPLSTLLRDPE